MNPFRLAHGLPHRPWLRLGLAALGLVLLAGVARQVDWRQFRIILGALDWTWAALSLLLGCFALGARTLRLTWILGDLSHFGKVWRAMTLGNLGRCFLPLGGGEFLKIGVLQTSLDLPAASAATGAVLDRLFDLLELAALLGLMTGMGVALHLRRGPLWLAAGGLAALVLGAALLFRPGAHGREQPALIARLRQQVSQVLAQLRRPALLGRLLVAEVLASVLDLAAIYSGLLAFAFGPALPWMVTVKLSAYLMLGAALPLLPGGMGTLQVACLLALLPAGVSSSGAFAYSLVAQATGFLLASILGGTAVFWPGQAARAAVEPASR